MSLSTLRIATVLLVLGTLPLVISCGHDGFVPEEQADAVAQEIDDYFVQADLTPVDQVEVEAVDDAGEVKAADEAATAGDDIACDSEDENCDPA
jgi:hypothetical protein